MSKSVGKVGGNWQSWSFCGQSREADITGQFLDDSDAADLQAFRLQFLDQWRFDFSLASYPKEVELELQIDVNIHDVNGNLCFNERWKVQNLSEKRPHVNLLSYDWPKVWRTASFASKTVSIGHVKRTYCSGKPAVSHVIPPAMKEQIRLVKQSGITSSSVATKATNGRQTVTFCMEDFYEAFSKKRQDDNYAVSQESSTASTSDVSMEEARSSPDSFSPKAVVPTVKSPSVSVNSGEFLIVRSEPISLGISHSPAKRQKVIRSASDIVRVDTESLRLLASEFLALPVGSQHASVSTIEPLADCLVNDDIVDNLSELLSVQSFQSPSESRQESTVEGSDTLNLSAIEPIVTDQPSSSIEDRVALKSPRSATVSERNSLETPQPTTNSSIWPSDVGKVDTYGHHWRFDSTFDSGCMRGRFSGDSPEAVLESFELSYCGQGEFLFVLQRRPEGIQIDMEINVKLVSEVDDTAYIDELFQVDNLRDTYAWLYSYQLSTVPKTRKAWRDWTAYVDIRVDQTVCSSQSRIPNLSCTTAADKTAPQTVRIESYSSEDDDVDRVPMIQNDQVDDDDEFVIIDISADEIKKESEVKAEITIEDDPPVFPGWTIPPRVDTTIVTSDGFAFPVCMGVLCLKSPYFKGLDRQDTSGLVTPSAGRFESQFTAEVMMELLQFVYDDDFTANMSVVAVQLYQAANVYLFEKLKGICMKEVIKQISLEKLRSVVELADQIESIPLMQKCIAFMRKRRTAEQSVQMSKNLQPLVVTIPDVHAQITGWANSKGKLDLQNFRFSH